jgi:small subunit ribosomal protein S16
MATKIRLQRFGKKGKPFYHVVVADARAPRDGKFIERLGSYNPNTNPATIEINFEKALDWVNKGAQPTDTCRAILSYKGILYKKHLEGGVKKGALTEEQAEAKFAQWLEGKAGKIEGKKDILTKSKEEIKKATLLAEAKKKEDMAAAIIAKNTPAPEVEETVVEEAPEVEEAAEVEVSAEEAAPVAEVEASAEVEEAAPVAEEAPVVEEAAPVAEEAPVVEEVAPVVEVEAAEEAPAAEATEEAPSDEKAV